jgi:hypothetical protein
MPAFGSGGIQDERKRACMVQAFGFNRLEEGRAVHGRRSEGVLHKAATQVTGGTAGGRRDPDDAAGAPICRPGWPGWSGEAS